MAPQPCCPDVYFCPTSGDPECPRHGGFTVCCAHPELHRPPTAEELADLPRPARFFYWRHVDWPWWQWLCLVGIRGGDEWCNRTVGFRIPFAGALFVCLNIPLRTEPCQTCQRKDTS